MFDLDDDLDVGEGHFNYFSPSKINIARTANAVQVTICLLVSTIDNRH